MKRDMPTLVVDDQIFDLQEHGGISRYVAELISAFEKPSEWFNWRLTRRRIATRNRHATEKAIAWNAPRLIMSKPGVARRVNKWARKIDSPDLLHQTFYSEGYKLPQPRMGRVVTVYDMIPELFPALSDRNPHGAKREAVDGADLILCISENTRLDLVRLYGVDPERTLVVPLGVDPIFGPGHPKIAQWPDNYVLYTGNRSGYKDFDVLVTALSRIRIENPPWLIAVGGGSFTPVELAQLSNEGLAHRARQLTLTERELVSAYANARAFAFPSRYEGFGLPTLEAMASGCPAVLANSSSHPEVGGKAALYFQPGDAEELARRLSELLEDSVTRRRSVQLGLRQAGCFSWDRTVRETASAYGTLQG